mmetsp:Transcript_14376/g.28067  ORF Transcript_14376/g.28067 Transcript_14376/m.28067 type:complete len:145 (+) Transcript_14376:193-627(+)
MVASCYRRMGSSANALELYKKIHKQHPDNVECLMYMCTICKETNDPNYDEYNKLLRIAERAQQTEQNRYMKEDVEQDVQRAGVGDTPTNSPGRDPQRAGESAALNAKFNQEISERTAGQTLNAGNKEDDDWGDDDLGDDLLPGM